LAEVSDDWLSTQYVIDSNVFIEAKKRYYAFGICPGFWDSLLWHHAAGTVWSVDRVRTELIAQTDELATWVKETVPKDAFCSTNDQAVVTAYGEAVTWVHDQHFYLPRAETEFSAVNAADPWVIAYAKAKDMTLVTDELLNPARTKRVPIPNVCVGLHVPYMNSFQMLAALGAEFHWQSP
jgi:hypothetical protein